MKLTKGEERALQSIASAKRFKPERIGVDNMGVTEVVSVTRNNPEYRYIKRLCAKGKLLAWQYSEHVYEPAARRRTHYRWFEVALPEWNPRHRKLEYPPEEASR